MAGAGLLLAPRAERCGRFAGGCPDERADWPHRAGDPGHYAEHLGGVVYDGIWVGENSKVPNDGGIRRALVDHLRKIKAPLIRWPGGCFADSYDWEDGIGPRANRPTRHELLGIGWHVPDGPQKYEPMRSARASSCASASSRTRSRNRGHLRSLPALSFAHWVEYCNAPAGSTSLAKVRGRRAVQSALLGRGQRVVGLRRQFHARRVCVRVPALHCRVPGYGVPLQFIGAGPNSGDVEWTREFFAGLTGRDKNLINSLHGWALHHYSWNVSQGRTTDWIAGKGDALKFPPEDVRAAARGRQDGSAHHQPLGRHGRARSRHKVKLVVDEWGAWYRPGTQVGRRTARPAIDDA